MTDTQHKRIPPEMLNAYYLRAMHTFLGELQSAYQATGMTQKDIAERLGISEAYVSRCLRGHKNMTVRTMSNIARAMDGRIDLSVTLLGSLTLTNHPPPATWQKMDEKVASGGGVQERPEPSVAAVT